MERTVAVVAYDRVAVFELSVACEVFGLDRTAMGVPNYRLLVCAAEPTPLRVDAGFTIDTPHGLDALDQADTVIVPGWRDVEEVPPAPMLEAVRRAHRRGARLASLCSGAFVLAAAGLLDGRRATTHWMYAGRLAERHPEVRVDPAVLYVEEGDVFTSAGTAASIDLCLHLVRVDHGAEVANIFARRMVVPPHRDGGQAQYVEAPVPAACDDHRLAATMEWALGHLSEPLAVEQLAARAGMSPRTFARRFVATSGTTPARWLHTQRLAAAQRLLETSELSVDRVAESAGFGSAAVLRLHFARRMGTSPMAYRRAFQSPTTVGAA
jgi:AraC family transcriptional regulator, transcriptional activator FtrA